MTRDAAGPARRLVWLGLLSAIAATTAMDAAGLGIFSALPLLPLMVVFWFLGRHTRRQMAFRRGRPRHYLAAVVHPLLVIGGVTAVAFLAGVVDLSEADWGSLRFNLLIGGPLGIPILVLTEEGFFRGWLWGALRRAGLESGRVLIASSLGFTLWHVSAVTLVEGYALPPAQVPLYLANAFLMGIMWGALRRASGSVVVAGVSHALWNQLAYGLFAFGTGVGALGVTETWLFGPEVGWVGLAFNLAAAVLLWLWAAREERTRISQSRSAPAAS